MKFVFFLYLTVLLFDGSDSMDMKVKTTPRESIIENSKEQIDLKQLEFLDLLKVVKSKRKLQPRAVEVFKRREYKVEIDRQSSNNGVVNGNRLIISNSTIILGTLKIFGSGIEHLNIVNEWDDTKPTDEMNQYINDYVGDSLTYLEVMYIYNDTFDQFTAPFKRVDELHFTVDYKFNGMNNGTLTLNQLFPKLRRLCISLRGYADWEFIDHEYSHLEDLTIDLFEIEWHEMDRIEDLLRKNPQIRIASFRQLPSDFIHVVSKLLPNLENMTIDKVDIRSGKVHFDHVKHFRLQNNDATSIGGLSFSSLETLRMDYDATYADEWSEFVERNSNLSRLQVELKWKEYEPDLVKLLGKLPNLNELSIEAVDDIDFERIRRIINVKKLVRFKFKTIYPRLYDLSVP